MAAIVAHVPIYSGLTFGSIRCMEESSAGISPSPVRRPEMKFLDQLIPAAAIGALAIILALAGPWLYGKAKNSITIHGWMDAMAPGWSSD